MNLGTRGALTFRLGDYCFAVRVEEAGGVLDADRLAQLPGVCNPVAGVVAFRGEMVPVVDLAEYLAIERPFAQGSGYALVLTRGPDRFALLIPEIPRLIPGKELREVAATDTDSELGDLIESMLENDQVRFHCLNYWRIFETIIPPAGSSAGKSAPMERGN
jgi:chemotaxis signal transduction protein